MPETMAINDAVDDAQDPLSLKKKARRRLVGAAALALLAIVVLPAVMDSEPKPVAQDIQVRIPSQDGNEGLADKVLSGKPMATPLPVAAESKPEAPVAAVPDTHAATAIAKADNPRETSKPEAKPESAAIAPKPRADTKSDVKSPPKVEAKSDARTESKADKSADKTREKPADKAGDKATKSAEEARAAAALEGKSAASTAGTGGQWVVQLGAYQNAGNVKLLLGKLKEMGVPAYTEKLDSPDGAKTRVRAGPFPSREAAEKAQTKIKIIGVSGPVGQK